MISYSDYKLLYEDKDLRWCYYALTRLGSLYASILKPIIMLYCSPIMYPVRKFRRFTEDYKNGRIKFRKVL